MKSLEIPAEKARLKEVINFVLDFAEKLRGSRGMSLQRYVLGVMLSSITTEANRLLKNVYGGRYQLFRSEIIGDKRQKGGLDLEILDHANGQRRSVKTLSGGEKFSLQFPEKCTILFWHTCRCDEMVDVADSKCASSILTPGEKVVAVASLFVYNKIR